MKKIGFVIQGLFSQNTAVLCNKLKDAYPNSFILVSTWKGQNIPIINADKILELDDPGPDEIILDGMVINKENTNRQYFSTRQGIIECDADVIFKVRSDFEFLKKANVKQLLRHAEQDKVIVTNINTIDPLSALEYIAHISDWVYVAKKTILLQIFASATIPKYLFENYSSSYRKNGFTFGDFTAEQLMFKQYFDKQQKFDNSQFYTSRKFTKLKYLKILCTRFEIYKLNSLGFEFKKHKHFYKFNLKYWKQFLGFWAFTIDPYAFRIYKKLILHKRLNLLERTMMHLKLYVSKLANKK